MIRSKACVGVFVRSFRCARKGQAQMPFGNGGHSKDTDSARLPGKAVSSPSRSLEHGSNDRLVSGTTCSAVSHRLWLPSHLPCSHSIWLKLKSWAQSATVRLAGPVLLHLHDPDCGDFKKQDPFSCTGLTEPSALFCVFLNMPQLPPLSNEGLISKELPLLAL